MKFKKEFPSLKDKELILDGDEDGYEWYRRYCDNWLDQTSPVGCFTQKDIQKYCFDKRRGKKIIDKLLVEEIEECENDRGYVNKEGTYMYRLKKELGLE